MAEPRWYENGPQVSVEFARKSQDGRLTLVIEKASPPITVLWAVMKTPILSDAIESLRAREGTTIANIGVWENPANDPFEIPGLGKWAKTMEANAVIWTALPSGFNGVNSVVPSLAQALEYLKSLDGEAKKLAENYIRNAPTQIRTPYRAAIESELGWK